MTVSELQEIIKFAKDYFEVYSEYAEPEYSVFMEKIYNPVKEAITSNNADVVKYLTECSIEDRRHLKYSIKQAVEEDGIIKENAVRLGFGNVAKLYQKVCEEFKILQDAD